MFEIGSTLREARRRRGLELADCERATRIRGRHLAAIEEEQWDRLPEPVYVRAFLRTYATFLDVDPRLVLDEFDSRQPAAEEEPEVLEPSRGPLDAAVRRLVAPRPRPRRRRVGLVWLSIGALGVLALVIWLGASRGGTPTVSLPPAASAPAPAARAPAAAAAVPRPRRAQAAAPPAAAAAARGVTLTVAGLGTQGSWVERAADRRRAGPVGGDPGGRAAAALDRPARALCPRRVDAARGRLGQRPPPPPDGWDGELRDRPRRPAARLNGGPTSPRATRSPSPRCRSTAAPPGPPR